MSADSAPQDERDLLPHDKGHNAEALRVPRKYQFPAEPMLSFRSSKSSALM
jgi:hypothetical protein